MNKATMPNDFFYSLYTLFSMLISAHLWLEIFLCNCHSKKSLKKLLFEKSLNLENVMSF